MSRHPESPHGCRLPLVSEANLCSLAIPLSTSIVGRYLITFWLAWAAVTGAGFIARGISFENTAGPEQHQAVALRVESDKSAFQDCAILGHQDSLFTHSLRQFFKDCTVAGTVDFIFGNSAAMFQTCNIVVRVGQMNGSSTRLLTAQVSFISSAAVVICSASILSQRI